MTPALRLAAFLLLAAPAAGAEDAGTLRVFLLAGQSNMEGHGYCHLEGDEWLESIGYPDATALEYLITHPEYVRTLDGEKFTFLKALAADWLNPRTDVWAVHMDSGKGEPFKVKHTRSDRKDEWVPGEKPLQCGFGNQANDVAKFGPELAMGHRLGDRLDAPVYLFKSDRGGTALATAWRPPSAVKQRGGQVGKDYLNTVKAFRAFCKRLDADLADDGKLNEYANATGYEVCAFVWVHGWNDAVKPDRVKEYHANLVDLVADLRRDLDLRALPAIIVESADNKAEMNAARKKAVAELNLVCPGRAVFVPTGGLKSGARGGFHWEARAEIFLEAGWRAAGAILDHDFTRGRRPRAK